MRWFLYTELLECVFPGVAFPFPSLLYGGSPIDPTPPSLRQSGSLGIQSLLGHGASCFLLWPQHSAFVWPLVHPLGSGSLLGVVLSGSRDWVLSVHLPSPNLHFSLSGSCPWPAETSVSKDAHRPGGSSPRCPPLPCAPASSSTGGRWVKTLPNAEDDSTFSGPSSGSWLSFVLLSWSPHFFLPLPALTASKLFFSHLQRLWLTHPFRLGGEWAASQARENPSGVMVQAHAHRNPFSSSSSGYD